MDELKQVLRDYGAVFMKTEDVITLPDTTFIDVKVPTTPAYKKFMKNNIVTVDGVELVGDTSLTKQLYARQLCTVYNKDKLEALKDLIDSTEDRLIIFYNFNSELDQLKALCESIKRPYSQVNGSVRDLVAYEDNSDSITLIQYQAGAMGLNLQKANKIIYYAPTVMCELWMQSQKRTHRIGQNRPCFYYTLTCDDSIEEHIYNALKKGVDYTDYLFKHEFCKR